MSDNWKVAPHMTAIARKDASTVAKQVVTTLSAILPFQSILDYGCGYGVDVHYYRAKGYKADGYDVHKPFGWSQVPTDVYDIITVVFVLNVLATAEDRLAVLQQASKHLEPYGAMLVVARSFKEIEKNAISRRWSVHEDGYWSNRSKGQFQHGMVPEEIQALAARAGLTPHPKTSVLRLSPNAHKLLRRS